MANTKEEARKPEPRAVCNRGTPLVWENGMPFHALTGQPMRRQGYKGEDDWDIGLRFDEDKQRFDDWAALSAQDKSQVVSDRRFPEGERFQVSIPGDSAQVVLVVRANSDSEARERYREICGIGACDHEIVATSLDGTPKPAKAKKGRKQQEERPVSSLGIEPVEENVKV